MQFISPVHKMVQMQKWNIFVFNRNDAVGRIQLTQKNESLLE